MEAYYSFALVKITLLIQLHNLVNQIKLHRSPIHIKLHCLGYGLKNCMLTFECFTHCTKSTKFCANLEESKLDKTPIAPNSPSSYTQTKPYSLHKT